MPGKKLNRKRKMRQVAALPFRRTEDGKLLVLVMTSRETRRAVIPKGWRMRRHKDRDAAAIEAFQEAGVVGTVAKKACGSYRYWKRLPDRFVLVKVHVFPLEVTEQSEDWPEKDQRIQAWLPAEDAALLVDEPQLKTLVDRFGRRKAGAAAD